jgi:Kef-type K+ transport system membrane component KefB
MFWIVFIIILFFIWLGASILEFFEQMKESEYEIVRIIYWVFVVGVWLSTLIWVLSW